MISARMSVATASSMFEAEFHEYHHQATPTLIIRAARGFMLPSRLQGYVYTVGNLKEFPEVRRLISVAEPDDNSNFGSDCAGCQGKVTPAVLAEAYELDTTNFVADRDLDRDRDRDRDRDGDRDKDRDRADTGMAVAEFQGVYYDNTSLTHFEKDCALKQRVQVDHQVGPNHAFHCLAGFPCTEALLDIEYAKAVSGGIPLTNIYNPNYSLLDWAKQVDDMGDAGPAVHSVSYGDDEVQQDDDSPKGMTGLEYMQAVNVQFAKLAARGISVFVASGDQGVCGRSGCSYRSSEFHPDFPASSPYVTAVGGTDFNIRSVVGEEKAWSSSGGGFSNAFPTPAWQKEAVQKYLTASAKAGNLPPAKAFNQSGRAYPDVSALGGEQNPYCIAARTFIVDLMQGVAGTSASSPVFAAIVARLNSARRAKGMPRMGFMNPWIYAHEEAFHDVTKGVNDDGDDGSGRGFAAMPGWDPATGVGSPRYEAMLHAALNPGSSAIVV